MHKFNQAAGEIYDNSGRAEPGLLGPSYLWVGSPRFPGSGFLLTPPNRSGLPPPPAPGMFFSSPALLPKGRPLGDATAPPPTRGAQEGAM